jgi:hypothetical protein
MENTEKLFEKYQKQIMSSLTFGNAETLLETICKIDELWALGQFSQDEYDNLYSLYVQAQELMTKKHSKELLDITQRIRMCENIITTHHAEILRLEQSQKDLMFYLQITNK